MIHPAIPISLFALAAPATAVLADAAPRDQSLEGVEVAQMSIHERVIIRVPRMSVPPGRAQAPRKLEWREHGGPKCVTVADIAGAMRGPPGTIDLVTNSGVRLRAKLDGDCRGLDYYSGFYLKPASDGLMCRDRDVIQMRSGAKCAVEEFKKLKLKQ